MTYRDPNDRNADMSYRDSTDSMGRTYSDPVHAIGALVVIVLIAAAIAFATSRSSVTTASGPSTTQSMPTTTGQGGPAR